MTVADQVRRLIAQHLGIDAGCVTDEALFRDDLGADSLDAFELLMTFEDVFGIEIPDAAADPMQRVSDDDGAPPLLGGRPQILRRFLFRHVHHESPTFCLNRGRAYAHEAEMRSPLTDVVANLTGITPSDRSPRRSHICIGMMCSPKTRSENCVVHLISSKKVKRLTTSSAPSTSLNVATTGHRSRLCIHRHTDRTCSKPSPSGSGILAALNDKRWPR